MLISRIDTRFLMYNSLLALITCTVIDTGIGCVIDVTYQLRGGRLCCDSGRRPKNVYFRTRVYFFPFQKGAFAFFFFNISFPFSAPATYRTSPFLSGYLSAPRNTTSEEGRRIATEKHVWVEPGFQQKRKKKGGGDSRAHLTIQLRLSFRFGAFLCMCRCVFFPWWWR